MPSASTDLDAALARFRELVAEADRLDTEAARIAEARDAVSREMGQLEDSHPDVPLAWF